MSKRSDKVLAQLNATIDTKIETWKGRIAKYEDYQQTYGGFKYYDKIAELEEDIKALEMFRQSAVQTQKQKEEIAKLKAKLSEYKLFMHRVADKLIGYGEFEVLIRQLRQTADSK